MISRVLVKVHNSGHQIDLSSSLFTFTFIFFFNVELSLGELLHDML